MIGPRLRTRQLSYAVLLVALLAGCASEGKSAHGGAVAANHLPPVPAALIAELSRHQQLPIQVIDPNTPVHTAFAAALPAAKHHAQLGKITSASLVTMGVPGTQQSLTTPHTVWLFGIADPVNVDSHGPLPRSGESARVNFAAQMVNATTGRWIQAASGYDPNYRG